MPSLSTRFGIGFIAAAMLAAAAPASAETGLKIGALMPLSGEMKDYGPAALNGIKLAVEQINKAGGVLGAPMGIAVADDQTSPQAGAEAAQKLVSGDKVNAIVGPMNSGVYVAVAKMAAVPDKIPMISGSAASPVISTLPSNGFTFRTVPSDSLQGVALAQVARDKGYGSVSVVHVNDDYGQAIADAFQQAFSKAGGKVAQNVGFDAKQPSVYNELQKAASANADALVLIARAGEGTRVLKGALDSGSFNRFVFSDGMKSPQVIEAVGGQFLDGAAGAAPAAAVDTPAAEGFHKAYAAKFGNGQPTPYTEGFYDTVYLLALAAEKAKSTDGAKLRDALREVSSEGGEKVGPADFAKAKQLIAQGKKIDYVGASGPVHFDAHGDVAGRFAQWEIQDGKISTIRVFEPKM